MPKLDHVWIKRPGSKQRGRILNRAEKAHFSVWHWAQMGNVLTQGINDRSQERSSHDIDACRDIQHFCLGMAMECLLKLYCMVEEKEYPGVHCLQELAATEGIEEHIARFRQRVEYAKIRYRAVKTTRRQATKDKPKKAGDILEYFDDVMDWNTIRYAFADRDPNKMRYYIDDAQSLFNVINEELGIIAKEKLGWRSHPAM